MSKRAILKHGPVAGLDALEERTLLSPVPIASAAQPRAVLVEELEAPVAGFGGAHRNSGPTGPNAPYTFGYAVEVVEQGTAAPAVPTGWAPAAPARGATAAPVTTLFITEYAVSNATAPLRHVELERGLDGPFLGLSVPSGPFLGLGSVNFPSHAAREVVSLPVALRGGAAWPMAMLNVMPDLTVDDRVEMSREVFDGPDPVYLPVARADGSAPALLAQRASTPHSEEHALHSPPTGPAVPAGTAVGQRVDSPGRDLLPSPQAEAPWLWPVLGAPDIPDVARDGLSAIVVEAARAAGAAVGSVVVQVAGPERGPQAPAAPAPEGIGLIAEVLPFDGNTVAAAIDRFFERFDDPSADEPETAEPAGLTPPRGVALIAVAAVELARRRWQRRRQESAAFGARRRSAERLRAEAPFGSCGPWSSRLS